MKTPYIASLDIETLSLDLNCVIFEVGVAMLPERARDESLNALRQSKFSLHEFLMIMCPMIFAHGISVDRTSQSPLNGVIDPDTVKFHETIRDQLPPAKGPAQTDPLSKVRDPYFEKHQLLSPEASLTHIRVLLQEATELWINHPAFDSARLNSLRTRVGQPNPLWNYRIEHDVATVRHFFGTRMSRIPALRALGVDKSSVDSVINNVMNYQFPEGFKHGAVYDAVWNLLIALSYEYVLVRMESTQ